MFSNNSKPLSVDFKRNMFWHLPAHALFAVLIYFKLLPVTFLLPFLILCIILSLIYKRWEIPGIKWAIKHLERKKNLETLPGIEGIISIIAVIIIVAFFSPKIGAASVMILAVGDSIPFLVGRYGALKSSLHKNRNVEGIFAGIVCASLCAWAFVPLFPAFVAALVSLLFEFTGIKIRHLKINDNFYIPIISAIILTILL